MSLNFAFYIHEKAYNTSKISCPICAALHNVVFTGQKAPYFSLWHLEIGHNKGRAIETETHDFSIKVYKQYFNFAASHFMIFPDGTREPLHGHNYRVNLEGKAQDLVNDMVIDFLDIKPIVKDICDSLDHKLIVPKENEFLNIFTQEKNTIIETHEGTFSIPSQDVLLLPIVNSSVERIAVYISELIRSATKKKFNFEFKELSVELEESPGQSAIYTYKAENKS